VHSQQRMRRLVRQPDEAAQLIFGQQHGEQRLAEHVHKPNADCLKQSASIWSIEGENGSTTDR
jgi:hypothetical protein